VNVKKTKVMVFNYADPCQEFVFEGDVIEHVQTFKYLGILLETTLNLECPACSGVSSSCLQAFAVCTEPPLYEAMYYGRCDLFNMLVCSIASYAYEVWVDSKKIEAIEVTY